MINFEYVYHFHLLGQMIEIWFHVFFFLNFFFFFEIHVLLFIYLFIYDCVESSFLCEGFL